jgi:hypothetical protein
MIFLQPTIETELMKKEYVEIPPKYDLHSCVGYNITGPESFPMKCMGNYFWFTDPNGLSIDSRCLNMGLESMKEASRRFLNYQNIKVVRYTELKRGYSWSIVVDTRIPKDWLWPHLYWTGANVPCMEILLDMYAEVGDPTFELEQFTNPASYWEKRGGHYSNGWVSIQVGGKSKPVPGKGWKMTEEIDCGFANPKSLNLKPKSLNTKGVFDD